MEAIKNRPGYAVMIITALWLASFSGLYPQYQLSALAYEIVPKLRLTPSQFSGIFAAPMIPAVFLSILLGVLADRFGAKKIVGAGLVIAATATCLRIFSETRIQLFVLMLLSGFGASFLNATAAKIIGSWYPPEKTGKMMGIFLMSSTLAMTAGTGTTAWFPSVRAAYLTAAGLSAFAALFWVLFMKDQPIPFIKPVHHAIVQPLLLSGKNRTVWLVGLCLMFIIGCVISLTAFLPNALISTYDIAPKKTGLLSALITFGTLVGSLAGPFICEKTGLMRLLMMGAGLTGALGAAFAWQAPAGFPMAVGLLATGMALGTLLPLLMSFPALLPEIGPVYAGSAGGIISTLQLLGAVLIPTYIITPISGDNYGVLFGMAGGCMVLMTLLVPLLPELGGSKMEMVLNPELRQ